ncbi:Hypothetical predicted protein, partial [Marmota monax]
PFCEELMKPPNPYSHWEEKNWQKCCSAYICECPKEVLSQNCETDVNECSEAARQIGTDCVNKPD